MTTEYRDRWSLRLIGGRGAGGEGFEMRSKNGERATVFVVEDDPAMRELLRLMLAPLDAEVETYASAEEFLENWDGWRAGCLLLDLRLPGMDGLSLFDALRGQGASLPVIFVTGYADVATARQVLKAGAADLLQKPVEARTLVESVRAAFAAGQATRETRRMCASLDHLTRREWQVLRLVVAGKPNKVISAELGISQKTVEAHRARVMAKTQADSVADLVRMFSAFESQRRTNEPETTRWRRAQ